MSTKPHPGWTVATTERKLAKPITAEGFTLSKVVATVTWTASGASAGIGPGEFDEFELSLGAFPSDVDTLSFPTTQTYSDGTVVVWDQASVEGQDEPEHPAPTLELAAATQAADATVPGHRHLRAARRAGPRRWLPRSASCWPACSRSASPWPAKAAGMTQQAARVAAAFLAALFAVTGGLAVLAAPQRPRTRTWSGRCPATGRRSRPPRVGCGWSSTRTCGRRQRSS